MYLAKVMTPRSLPEIGRRFGGRDHTTVLHAVRKIEDLSGSDNNLAQELELLRRLISDQACSRSPERAPVSGKRHVQNQEAEAH
jgi:chromosomal replication initiator protein